MNKNVKTTNTKKKGILPIAVVTLVIALFALVIALMALVYTTFAEKPVEGAKSIRVEVIGETQNATLYEISTEQEYLLGALEEIEDLEFEGEDGPYGPMITTINGEFAEYNTNGAYWSFYVNEEYCNYGVSEQPVEDGDVFKIVYTLAE